MFSLVSLLEMHLGFWVRAEYPDDSWQTKLSRPRLAAAERLQRSRRARRQHPFLIDCLQFCDKRDLVLEKEGLRNRLSLGTKARASQHLKKAEELRNLLAHSQDELVDGSTWEELIDVTFNASEISSMRQIKKSKEKPQNTQQVSVAMGSGPRLIQRLENRARTDTSFMRRLRISSINRF